LKTLKQKHAELCDLIGENEVKKKLHSWYDRSIKRERKRSEVQSASELQSVDEFCRLVLEDLHQRTGFTYRLGKETRASIIARKNDGFTLEDFKKVHEIKSFQWLDDPKFCQYLHPSTLYRPTKFEKYLVQHQIKELDENRKKEKAKNRKSEEAEKRNEEPYMTPEEAAEWREKVHGILGNISKRKRMRT
jgi:uncharacterized phage protein (TIGR02220 family)